MRFVFKTSSIGSEWRVSCWAAGEEVRDESGDNCSPTREGREMMVLPLSTATAVQMQRRGKTWELKGLAGREDVNRGREINMQLDASCTLHFELRISPIPIFCKSVLSSRNTSCKCEPHA